LPARNLASDPTPQESERACLRISEAVGLNWEHVALGKPPDQDPRTALQGQAEAAEERRFRHTCASLLFEAGRNIEQVQEWLGHADPGFTLRTYVHLLDAGVGTRASSTRCSPRSAAVTKGNERPAEDRKETKGTFAARCEVESKNPC
jgi:hypothetical protein